MSHPVNHAGIGVISFVKEHKLLCILTLGAVIFFRNKLAGRSASWIRQGSETTQTIDKMGRRLSQKKIDASQQPISVSKTRSEFLKETETQSATLNSYLDTLANHAQFRGAVLIVKEKRILLCKGYGNAIGTEKNTISTTFQIGSVTKQFTAAAILKLAEEGVVDLHKPIKDYLPKQYQSDKWNQVTLHQILSHTSGIGNYLDDPNYFKTCKELNIDKILRMEMQKDLLFSPGTKFKYSNTGYMLLGAIIENMSKPLSYGEFIRQKILIPAGMEHSGVNDKSYIPGKNTAVGFCPDSSGERLTIDDTEDISMTCGADGAIYSTLEDLYKWSKVLEDGGRVLSPESLKLMKTPVLEGYGYGLGVERDKEWHNGAVPGFQSSFYKFPSKDLFICILCNNGKFPTEQLADDLSRMLLGQEINPLIVPKKFTESEPLLGTFQSKKFNGRLEFLVTKEGRLFLRDLPIDLKNPKPKEEIYLLSNGRYLNLIQSISFELSGDEIQVYDLAGKQIDILVRLK